MFIQIEKNPDGSHASQYGGELQEGWAYWDTDAVPLPESFPWVDIVVEDVAHPEIKDEENGKVLEAEYKQPEVVSAAACEIPKEDDSGYTATPSNEELAASVQSLQSATAVAFVTLCEAGSIDAVTAGEHVELFSSWAYPVAYKTGSIREHGGKLYRCLQDHTSQEAWTPDAAPSLWVGIADPAEEWPEWSQPVGSTDAYAKGDKVSHNGKRWTSDVDNNVWEPGVYGWTEATE